MSGHARFPGTASATRSVARSVPAITVAMLLPNTDTKLLFRSTLRAGRVLRGARGRAVGAEAARPFGPGRIGPLTGRKRVAAAPRRGVYCE